MALADQVGGLAHDFRAVVGRGRAPHREAFLGGFERLVEIRRARVRQVRQRLLGRRIDHVLAPAAVAVEPLAVDVEFEIGVHESLLEFLVKVVVRCRRHPPSARPVRLSWAVFAGRWCSRFHVRALHLPLLAGRLTATSMAPGTGLASINFMRNTIARC